MNSVHPSYPSRGQQKHKPTNGHKPSRGVKQGWHQYDGSRQAMGRGGESSGRSTVVVTRHGAAKEGGATDSDYPDHTRAIILSCAVTWLFCVVLGIVGFVYAIRSRSSDSVEEAQGRLVASYKASAAGFLTGLFLFVVILAISITLRG